MSDPYRIEGPRSHEALLAEERALLVGAGKVMVVAGVIGLVAAIVGLAASYRGGLFAIAIGAGLPALLSALTLQAGVVLSRLPAARGTTGRSSVRSAACTWCMRSRV